MAKQTEQTKQLLREILEAVDYMLVQRLRELSDETHILSYKLDETNSDKADELEERLLDATDALRSVFETVEDALDDFGTLTDLASDD